MYYSTVEMKRNPLSIAFGHAIKTIRQENSIPVAELSAAIGINDSYYRVLESGATTIHTSKAIEIYNGLESFEVGVDYRGVRDILLGISYVNNFYVKTKTGYIIDKAYKSTLLEHLMVHEYKLSVLLNDLDSTGVFENLDRPNSYLIEMFEDSLFDHTMEKFILDYRNVGESIDVIEHNFINDFFREVPTYYFESLNVIKQQLLDMPVSINLKEMRKWELRNGEKFKDISIVVTDHNLITGFKNLKNYKYPYLKNKHFESATVIYLNDNQPKKPPFNEFHSNLLKAHDFKSEEDLTLFSKTVKKVRFIRPPDDLRKKGLQILNHENVNYNVTWFFTLASGIKVGFTATIIEKEDEMLYTEGLSLKYENLIKRLEYVNKVKAI